MFFRPLAGTRHLAHTQTGPRSGGTWPPSSHASHLEAVIAAVPSIGRAAGIERPARDADATQDLYERYSGQIFGFCVNQLGSRDEAEDAVQSTFLNAHRALQRGVTPEAELAWLFKIAHNVCLTRRRSTRRRGRVEAPSDLGAVQDVLPAPARESADELIRLTDALSHMPDNQRRAILLREWQGLSYHEIAGELKLSQSAVETLIFRARRTLAANLEVEPERPSVLARARAALDVGMVLAAVKALFSGGAAVKAAAAAVAVSGAAVVATAPPERAPAPVQQPKTVVVEAAPRVEQPAPAVLAPVTKLDTDQPSRPARAAKPRVEPKPEPPAAPAKAVVVEHAGTAPAPAPAPAPRAEAPAPAAQPPARSTPPERAKGKSEEKPRASGPPSSRPTAPAPKPEPRGKAKAHEKQRLAPAQARGAAPKPKEKTAPPVTEPTPAPAPPAAAAPPVDPAAANGNGNAGGNGNGQDPEKDKGPKK